MLIWDVGSSITGYDEENPMIKTACGHHFHLGCIFEWAERKPTCPVCEKVCVVLFSFESHLLSAVFPLEVQCFGPSTPT